MFITLYIHVGLARWQPGGPFAADSGRSLAKRGVPRRFAIGWSEKNRGLLSSG
jgi:hypothetical protein